MAAPRGSEATTEAFHFWVPEDRLVEKTQLVHVESPTGGRDVHFYGLVTEVFRRSRRNDMLEESDRFDGRPEEQVPLESRGVTYASVRVLATEPSVFTPPREESVVYPAGEPEARIAYGVGDMEKPVVVGLVRNGGEADAGPAYVDLDYLLGAKGGHLNVAGIAGVGTKSSFLTIALSQVLRYCRRHAEEHPEDPEKPQVRAVILNVKGFDLFWLDHWSRAFSEEDRRMWEAMGWGEPSPMDVLAFFAPQQPGSDELAAPVGRSGVRPYSWSLEDVIRDNLFTYLFSDSDREDDNFALLLADMERLLAREWRQNDGTPMRELRRDAPARTFQELFDWFEHGLARGEGREGDEPPRRSDLTFERLQTVHHAGTLRRFYRRLRRIVYESAGIFRMEGGGSHPLDISALESGRPIVVDIQSLPDRHLQRFVVAALLKQAVEQQTGARRPARHALPLRPRRAQPLRPQGSHRPHHPAHRDGGGGAALAGGDPPGGAAAGLAGLAAGGGERLGARPGAHRRPRAATGRLQLPAGGAARLRGAARRQRQGAAPAQLPPAHARARSPAALGHAQAGSLHRAAGASAGAGRGRRAAAPSAACRRVPTTSCPEMRLLHTSDWHLGARLGNQDRLPDQLERLEEICRYLDENEVDVLLVAGDVFDEHRSEALARIIARLARLLKPRIEAGMWAVFIAGNHDREHVFPLIRGLQDLLTAESSLPAGQAGPRVVFAERPALVPVTARSGEQVQLMLLPYPTPTRYELPDERLAQP